MPSVPQPFPALDSALSPAQRGPSLPKVLLTIAGFDPAGGAGILADIKTFHAHGLYGMACITALTVQNTQGVRAVEPVAAATVQATLQTLAEDVSFAAIKIGMLATGAVAAVVADFLDGLLGSKQRTPTPVGDRIPVVLDPIVRSSSGAELLDAAGRQILQERLLAVVGWVTPNLPELAVWTGRPVATSRAEVEASAQALLQQAVALGNPGLRIVVTGGHAERPDDLLWTGTGGEWFAGERVETRSTHGTGCTFSSALAARLALGDGDAEAVRAAKAYGTEAIRAARPIGQGHGPLEHFWPWQR